MRRLAVPLALLAAAVALSVTGCDGDEPAATDGKATEPAQAALGVYLVRDEQVSPVRRHVPHTAGVARAALEQLLAGPSAAEADAGYGTLVPDGTELLDVAVADGVATVDLSQEFTSGGGSLSMQLRVAQVVYTLTRFPTVERVAFRIEGEPVAAIGGEGIVVSPAVGRGAFEGVTPQILVEEPLPGDVVTAPLRVRGTANVFEATVSLDVEGEDGSTLASTFTTATAGTGTWGTFAAAVELPAAASGPIRLVAFERSAQDGSRIHVVEVPLELSPSPSP